MFTAESCEMPGFNLIVQSPHASAVPVACDRIAGIEAPVEQSTEVIAEDNAALLTMTAYPHYPVRVWRDERFVICCEGRIYGLGEDLLVRTAFTLAEAIVSNDCAAVTDGLLAHDGDFVFVILHKASGDWYVLNDVFGRLPIYLGRSDRGFTVTRNIGVAVAWCGHHGMNAVGAAQFLVFGHCLGEQTLWDKIRVLPSATLLRIGRNASSHLTQLHRFDFSAKATAAGDLREQASHLALLFRQSCTARGQLPGPHVVALSGGLDSRAVAAGLAGAEDAFDAVTMARPGWYSTEEIRIAQDVARRLGRPWRAFEVPPCRGADYSALLEIKQGLNELGMAFHLSFFTDIRRRCGSEVVYFTGDGGDKALPELRPNRRLADSEAMCDFTLDRRGVFTLTEAAAITGISVGELRSSLMDRFSGYPEADGVDKYVHFLIYERTMRWLFEGEDRNRHYFWSVAPFFSLPFFRDAMDCPAHLKKNYRLYREFLAALRQDLATLDKAGSHGAIGSFGFTFHHRFKAAAHSWPGLARRVQRALIRTPGFAATDEVARLLEYQIGTVGTAAAGVDVAACRHVVQGITQRPKRQVLLLLTLLSMIDRLHGGNSLNLWRERQLP
jgi:asparagine synthase (glutamine-hydrolysing)